MCLGIPGKVTEVYGAEGLQMGMVDFGGVRREVCLAYVADEVEAGDYVIVHTGFALSVLDEEEAQKTLALWDDMVAAAAAAGVCSAGAEALMAGVIPTMAGFSRARATSVCPKTSWYLTFFTAGAVGAGGEGGASLLRAASGFFCSSLLMA